MKKILNERQLRKHIASEVKKMLSEAEASDVPQEKVAPTELDKVDPVVAKVIVKSGEMDKDKNDDKISVTSKSWPAADLKPSQTTMRIDNTVGMAISMLAGKMDTNLGCIVSSDNHIMDGHHRWSAAILVDPKTSVSGYGAELPGKELVGVLNVLTKGVFNKKKGNPGKGSLADYTPENVKAALQKALDKGTQYYSSEEIKKLFEKKFGSVEEALDKMSSNVNAMSKEVPEWAPDRVQMPVIDPKEVPTAAKVLDSGKVDVMPPYSSVVKRAISGSEKSAKSKEKTEESVDNSGDVILERWQKLAGLIK